MFLLIFVTHRYTHTHNTTLLPQFSTRVWEQSFSVFFTLTQTNVNKSNNWCLKPPVVKSLFWASSLTTSEFPPLFIQRSVFSISLLLAPELCSNSCLVALTLSSHPDCSSCSKGIQRHPHTRWAEFFLCFRSTPGPLHSKLDRIIPTGAIQDWSSKSDV